MAKKRRKTKASIQRRKRYSLVAALVFVVAIVGFVGYRYITTRAATSVTVSGRIVDQNGNGIANVVFQDCRNNRGTSNVNGVFSMTVPTDTAGGPQTIITHCVRTVSLPPYVSNPVATNARGGNPTYEWQVGGLDCYQNVTYCKPGGPFNVENPEAVRALDMSQDNVFNFRATYSPPPPQNNTPPGGGGNGNSGGGNKKPSNNQNSAPASGRQNLTNPNPGGQLSPPTNLTANSNIIGVILNWNLASGGAGTLSYQIDRSTDQADWQSVATSVFGATYADTTAGYETDYFYRVRATDEAGANSEYVTTSVKTAKYAANTSEGGQTITSDDGVVNINIPTGAIKEDAACAVVSQSEIGALDESITIVLGPYLLVCREANGDLISELSSEAEVSVTITDDIVSQYKNFGIVVSSDEGSWNKVEASYNEETKTVSYKTKEIKTFAVNAAEAAKTSSIIIYVIVGIIIIGLIIVIIKKKDDIVEWFYRH